MITPMQMYWLLKLDDICGFSIVVLTVALLVFFFCTIGILAFCDKLCNRKRITKTRNIALCVALFFGSIAMFVPSTKQMAAIYVVPAIANNEKIQKIGGKALDISNQLLDLTKGYLEDKVKDK